MEQVGRTTQTLDSISETPAGYSVLVTEHTVWKNFTWWQMFWLGWMEHPRYCDATWAKGELVGSRTTTLSFHTANGRSFYALPGMDSLNWDRNLKEDLQRWFRCWDYDRQINGAK